VPIHFGTFPLLAGTPEELTGEVRGRTSATEVVVIEPGGTVPIVARTDAS
jgi:hypothetical protein